MTTIKPVPLTQNGNPYKKTSTATKVCTAISAAPLAALTIGSAFYGSSRSNIKLDAGILALGAILTAIGGAIGKFIGSAIDGQTNKTRMAQADGEAAQVAKNVNVNA